MSTQPLIVIAAGGTGGHVFPGLAVADKLREMQINVVWFGSDKGIEVEQVPRAQYPLECLSISGVRGKGLLGWWLFPWRLSFALWQALRLLRKYRPKLVLGMGGFVSGPVGLVACALDIPLVIHEQNAIAGLTNRWLALLARRVLLGFPNAFKKKTKSMAKNMDCVGNPVRMEVLNQDDPGTRLRERDGALKLLVIGGSRGAHILNVTMPETIAAISRRNIAIEVWHQTGRGNGQAVSDEYERKGISARVDEFINEVSDALLWSDLVICRAGAQTLAELAAVGAASILVPFPHAVDDHQTANAKHFADEGAAVLLPQDKLSANTLADMVTDLTSKRAHLVEMATAAHALARPRASEQVATICREEMAA